MARLHRVDYIDKFKLQDSLFLIEMIRRIQRQEIYK